LTTASSAPPTSEKKRGRSSQRSNEATKQWFCPDCILEAADNLMNREVIVWWRNDDCSYHGVINVYDPDSQTHRVLYDDQEWEFLDLTKEPYFFIN
jgi:hypothetical protein